MNDSPDRRTQLFFLKKVRERKGLGKKGRARAGQGTRRTWVLVVFLVRGGGHLTGLLILEEPVMGLVVGRLEGRLLRHDGWLAWAGMGWMDASEEKGGRREKPRERGGATRT